MARIVSAVAVLLILLVGALPAAAGWLAPAPKGVTAVQTHFLERPDGRIAYDDSGAGPVVVLVPGLGDLRAEYRFLTPQLVAAGYRVVAMDLRGHGESSVEWPDYSAAAIGSDVVALARALDAGPAFLVGTSMGAGAAAWAAAEAPGLVRGLVLIGPFVREIPPQSAAQDVLQKVMLRVMLARPWGVSAWDSYYTSLYPTAKPADMDGYRAALQANLRERGRLEAAKEMIWASKANVESRLDQVATPVLVVMGSKDPDFKHGPEVEAQLVADRLGGTMHMVEGAGHYPHAEMPDQTGPAVVAFLDAHRLDGQRAA